MKKISTMAVLVAMTTATAFAGSGNMANNNMNNNNMNNNMTEVVTVEQVRAMPDDSPVIIRGYLLRQNGENSYVFQDTTGTINLEIDAEDWGGLTISPTGMSMVEVDVFAIKKL